MAVILVAVKLSATIASEQSNIPSHPGVTTLRREVKM